MKSHVRALAMLTIFYFLILVAGYLWAERQGIILAFLISALIHWFVYFSADRRLLRLFQVRELEGQDPWGLLVMLRHLSASARIPQPRVFLANANFLNSFSLGRSSQTALIVIPENLPSMLSKEELEALLAFEVSRIKCQDTLAYGVVSTILRALLSLALLFDWKKDAYYGQSLQNPYKLNVFARLFYTVTFPLASLIQNLTIGRGSYLHHDQAAAQLTADAKHLAQVLWKFESYAQTQPAKIPAYISHLFAVNPLTHGHWARYFQAQPPTEARIRSLVGYYPI